MWNISDLLLRHLPEGGQLVLVGKLAES